MWPILSAGAGEEGGEGGREGGREGRGLKLSEDVCRKTIFSPISMPFLVHAEAKGLMKGRREGGRKTNVRLICKCPSAHGGMGEGWAGAIMGVQP